MGKTPVPDHRAATTLRDPFPRPRLCPLALCPAISSYSKELEKIRRTEARLRQAIVREKSLLRQKDHLIQQNKILREESDHRLMNGLQLVASLLSMQSRITNDVETAAQLTFASNRVATIARVHRNLHALDRVESVKFKQYLENLCRDLSGLLSIENPENVLVVEGIELKIPTTIGIPLGLIVSELVTNSIKYGKGKITVRLDAIPDKRYALSVSDNGPGLPTGFDPALSKGLGMKLIMSLIDQIGGELRIDRGVKNKNSYVTVLFS
jgi:two-component system, sensor histidine kinase PdtaS